MVQFQNILHKAALVGALEVVKMLALDRMNINEVNENGAIPAMLAACEGRGAVVKYLLT